jgi:type IV secretion system protein TrbL
MGYISFFENFVQIVVLLFAWIVVLLAFFILAIQLFITLIEFKLTTLAGFVLIPFGLFGKTAFAAERVLGNVISSGVKVLVLAVIVGIGSTLFSQFTAGVGGNQPTIEDAMAMVLAALALLGSASSVPASPTALSPVVRSSAPARLLAPASRLAAFVAAGGWCCDHGAGAAGGARAGAARGRRISCRRCVRCLSRGRYCGRRESRSLKPSPGSLRRYSGAAASNAADAGQSAASTGSSSAGGPPAWAARMKRSQTVSHGASAATHAVRSGDHGGGGASVDLSEGER